ncbi:hypothetical protein LCGC14_1452760 [marine sediment metagenome]|uniref:Uncharacterized protein n=1 Tax=marine sediment metagenome TaxID=412755 RepID=A0A0F9MJ39_9ZZZZ|nr:hypothetical protein [Methylophaga sp.]
MRNDLTRFSKKLIKAYEKSNQHMVNFVIKNCDREVELYSDFIHSDSQIDQNLLADVDNIFLYFSPKGIEMWGKKQIDGVCYTTIERLKLELTKC